VANNRYRREPLADHHNRADFSSGVEQLDRYFRQQASQDVRRKLAAVFVLYDARADRVVGHYTLSATSIAPPSLPSEAVKRLPRYGALPAVLLGRLAVDVRYRGQGFGRLLLFDALRHALAESEQIAAMAVVVDAKDDAARSFYERYGFPRFVDDAFRLFLPMADIRPL
jgi:GNAT superfamily N-acetyltransferase